MLLATLPSLCLVTFTRNKKKWHPSYLPAPYNNLNVLTAPRLKCGLTLIFLIFCALFYPERSIRRKFF